MTVTHSASQGWKNKNPLSSSSGQAQYQDLNSFQRKVNILKASSEPNYRNYTLIVQEGGREGGPVEGLETIYWRGMLMSFDEMFPNSRLSLSKWPKAGPVGWTGHMKAELHIVLECWRFATGHSSTLAFGNMQALLETFGQNNKTCFNLISLFYFPKARNAVWLKSLTELLFQPLGDIISNEWLFSIIKSWSIY